MSDALADQAIAAWRRHQEIMLLMLDAVPRGGLATRPLESKGRDVARQFAHVCRVREGWVAYHDTGKRPKLPRADAGDRPTKAQLRKLLRASGKEVDRLLVTAMAGDARIRMFGGNPLRWMSYLISHESHHRGLIALSLKQSGKKLPEDVAIGGIWGKWMHGAD